MNAISLLKRAGLSRADIAEGVGVTSHMVGMYERFQRFPGGEKFAAIVRLADSKGIALLAADFLKPRQRRHRK